MRTAKSIVELFEIVKDSDGKDWEHNKVRLEEIIEEYRSEQLKLNDVVVPKGTLCECKKHSLKTNYGFEVCTKCGNEFDD